MIPRPTDAHFHSHSRGRHRVIAVCLVVALPYLSLPLLWAAAPYVVLSSGKRVEGKHVTADENGQIHLTVAAGVLKFEPGTRVVMDEPPDIPRAIQMMQRGDDRSAVAILRKTAAECAFLEWDKKALRLLGRAQLNLGNFDGAASTYGKLLVVDPPARKEADVMVRYVKALVGAHDDATLLPLLDETIREGPRPAAAQAQMIRGRRLLAKGETRLALMDFMRTAELFEEENAVQKDSLLMTAECLAILKDSRSETYKKRAQ